MLTDAIKKDILTKLNNDSILLFEPEASTSLLHFMDNLKIHSKRYNIRFL